MTIFEWAFWASAAWVIYTYAGHPIALGIMSKFRSRPWRTGEATPSVSIYVAAYNESANIEKRIANLRSLDYPGDFEVVVADDGSSDETAALAETALGELGRVERSGTNVGKTAMQNLVVPKLAGDIVVFSDATSKWPPDLLRSLVRHFDDPDVGCVAADVKFLEPESDTAVGEQGAYWRYERMLRILGAGIWTNVVVSGTCYAIRRELFRELPPEIAEDLGTPLLIAAAGHRVVFDTDAVVLERSSASDAQEFRMRRRIALQNLTAIFRYTGTVLRGRRFAAYQFLAHKVGRAGCWLALIVALAANIRLAPTSCIYATTLAAQVAFYGLALAGHVASAETKLPSVVRLAKYFVILNMTYALSFLDFLSGRRAAQWRTER